MDIETLVYKVIKEQVPATYRYLSPTPGAGSYCVIDMVSDITSSNKDIHTMANPGSRCRMQAKIYSADADIASGLKELVQITIRTTRNRTEDNVTWIYASDPAGALGGYTPADKRFYYIIDFTVYYLTTSS